MTNESELTVLVDGITFPEGPRWREDRLWFSDFYTHRVYTVTEAGELSPIVEVPAQPSGLGWTPDGDLLIVSMRDRRLLRWTGKEISEVANLSELAPSLCNDMVVDAQGRAYVGNFGFDRREDEPERTTVLLRVDPDGSIHVAADDLAFPNGPVITPDGGRFIIAETMARRLTQFDIDADGGLSNRRAFAELGDCYPDGICLDAEGAIWVADARNNRVIRVHEGGLISREIGAGRQGCYACMLGGADRRTLFVCTSYAHGPSLDDPRDGRIETVRVDVPGVGLP